MREPRLKHTFFQELPEGELPSDYKNSNDDIVYSVACHALKEIDRFKWIVSEKEGSDCSKKAIEIWMDTCWKGWVRSKLLEHFMGARLWGAFGEKSYALFRRQTVVDMLPHDMLLKIGEKLALGGENLDIINWAMRQDVNMDSVLDLLERVDINSKRDALLRTHIEIYL